VSSDPSQHLFWLASRGFGVVALLASALSVGLGLAMAGRMLERPADVGRVKQLHEALALTTLVAIALHGGLLLGDSYLRPTLADITIPFQISTHPGWNAVGIVAGWLAVLLGLSFYARRRIGTRLWRSLHRWTIAVYILGVAHAVGAGTDGRSLWLLVLLAATALPILGLALQRFFPEAPEQPSRA